MSRPRTYIALVAICVALASWWLMFYSQFQMNEGFGIYLLDYDELVISDGDIIFYNGSSHEIKLTETGSQKIEKLSVRVPLNGTHFVMKIKGENIYDGWFWSPISSLPCSGIVIETLVRNNTIRIETGYPSSYFQGEDPRSDPKIFEHFQSIGKLVEQTTWKRETATPIGLGDFSLKVSSLPLHIHCGQVSRGNRGLRGLAFRSSLLCSSSPIGV